MWDIFHALDERKYKLLRQRYDEGYLGTKRKKLVNFQVLKSLVEEDDSNFFFLCDLYLTVGLFFFFLYSVMSSR